jgi:hypothetical protein
MIPLSLEQSDTTNRNKTENETIKTITIRYNEQQQNGKKPQKLEQSDKANRNKTENETIKTRTIR